MHRTDGCSGSAIGSIGWLVDCLLVVGDDDDDRDDDCDDVYKSI